MLERESVEHYTVTATVIAIANKTETLTHWLCL